MSISPVETSGLPQKSSLPLTNESSSARASDGVEFSLTNRVNQTSQIRLSAPIAGFVDYAPNEQYAFTTWLKNIGAVYESFGFTPVHFRPLERLESLKGDTDNQKQMFGVYRTDGNLDTGLALPFDHTVPLALYVAEHAGHEKEIRFPFKRYDLGLSFRGERPQVGRFRGFVQADVDIIGRNLGLSADAECICTLIKGLEALKIGSFRISINHIDIVKGIIRSTGVSEEFHPTILRNIDKLDKLTFDEVVQEILKIPSFPLTTQEVESLVSRFTLRPRSLEDFTFDLDYGPAANKGLQDLKDGMELLKMMNVDPNIFQFNPGMVRGLDYYTGIVFEAVLEGKESYGSIASGGRYSNLVGRFASGLEDVEGVGGSVGLTRLFDIMGKETLAKRATAADVLVGYRTNEQRLFAFEIATLLRQNAFKVDVYSGDPNVKAIFKHADAIGIPYTVIAMDSNAVVVKDMKAEGDRNRQREPDLKSATDVLDKLNFLKNRV